MPNIYVDTLAFRRRFINAAAFDSNDETEVLRILEASSRLVDKFCNRSFYALTATRVFHGNGRDLIRTPDLITATSVKLDEGEDGTFELTLASPADYWLEREGHEDIDAVPKTIIVLNKNGQRGRFVDKRRVLQIIGRWGYTEATENSLATVITGGWDAISTSLGTAGVALPLFAAGQTVLVENEQIYIREAVGTPQTLTVTRGVNGTTAATHAAGLAINRFVYVADVVEATMIQAGRLWKRRETAYATTIINPAIGSIEVTRGLDVDVQQLLRPYRLMAI